MKNSNTLNSKNSIIKIEKNMTSHINHLLKSYKITGNFRNNINDNTDDIPDLSTEPKVIKLATIIKKLSC
jgi:hypothetical protein